MISGSRVKRVTVCSVAVAAATAALTGLTVSSNGDRPAAKTTPGTPSMPAPDLAAGIPGPRPNIVTIMADDQDAASLAVMPNVRRLLAEQGAGFTNSFTSYPLCSPSRAAFLTGRLPHNNGVVENGGPDGGYDGFRQQETLPVWLSRAGYSTAHIGKYLNGYGTKKPREIPPGWQEWYGLTGRSTYRMWGFTINENRKLHTYGTMHRKDPKLYQTDILANKAVAYIERHAAKPKPFFLSLSAVAPHAEEPAVSGSGHWTAPRPAPRHAGAFRNTPLPRPPSFNETDVSDKPEAVRKIKRLAPAKVKAMAADHRNRLRSLLAVDDAAGRIYHTLKRRGILDRTLIIFTSDNGALEGQHRINDKRFPYEESIRVPLIMRGPGLRPGVRQPVPVSNVDVTATIMDVARARPNKPIDGTSVYRLLNRPRTRDILVETGPRVTHGERWYRAVRTDRWLYVQHSTGERELYDLRTDPYQLASRHNDPSLLGLRIDLERRLTSYASCAGGNCP